MRNELKIMKLKNGGFILSEILKDNPDTRTHRLGNGVYFLAYTKQELEASKRGDSRRDTQTELEEKIGSCVLRWEDNYIGNPDRLIPDMRSHLRDVKPYHFRNLSENYGKKDYDGNDKIGLIMIQGKFKKEDEIEIARDSVEWSMKASGNFPMNDYLPQLYQKEPGAQKLMNEVIDL